MTTTTTTPAQDFDICPVCGRGFKTYPNGKIRKHGFRSFGAGSWSNGCVMSLVPATFEDAARSITYHMLHAEKVASESPDKNTRYSAGRRAEHLRESLARVIKGAAGL